MLDKLKQVSVGLRFSSANQRAVSAPHHRAK
jgi:hypothetical protein